MANASVLTQWTKFGKLPFGRWMFSKMMGITVPYAASNDIVMTATQHWKIGTQGA